MGNQIEARPNPQTKVETVTLEYTNRDIKLAQDEVVFNLTVVDDTLVFDIKNDSDVTRQETLKIPEGYTSASIVDYRYVYEGGKVVGFRVIFAREVKREVSED